MVRGEEDAHIKRRQVMDTRKTTHSIVLFCMPDHLLLERMFSSFFIRKALTVSLSLTLFYSFTVSVSQVSYKVAATPTVRVLYNIMTCLLVMYDSML